MMQVAYMSASYFSKMLCWPVPQQPKETNQGYFSFQSSSTNIWASLLTNTHAFILIIYWETSQYGGKETNKHEFGSQEVLISSSCSIPLARWP